MVKCKECNTDACFNYIGEKAQYCKTHIKPGMVDVLNKKCKYKGCITVPTFNYENKTSGLYCKTHALKDMIDIVNKKCQHDKCDKNPNFNYPDFRCGNFCKDHKKDGMINVTSKKCKEDNCDILPTFNYEGFKEPLYCKKHCLENMVDVYNRRCEESGCDTVPYFNYIGNKIGRFCKKHALKDMIDVLHKKCKEKDCIARPSFNYNGEKEGLFCKRHAIDGMVDITSKKCEENGCIIRPNYNYKGLIGKYCRKHSKEGMIDVVHPCCKVCGKRACYGYPNNKPEYCAKHGKKDGLIKNPTAKCKDSNCKNFAIYGITKPLHCEDHKEESELNLIERDCESCKLPNILNENKLCYYCEPDIRTKFRLLKQNKVQALLDRCKIKYIQTDVMIDKGQCGKERPDFLFDCKTHYVILEVDEHQHNDRTKECERVRMINITNSLGMPVIFLRYNPDNFRNNGKNVEITELKRHKLLIQWLKHIIQDPPKDETQFLRIVYMFYNNFDKSKFEYLTGKII